MIKLINKISNIILFIKREYLYLIKRKNLNQIMVDIGGGLTVKNQWLNLDYVSESYKKKGLEKFVDIEFNLNLLASKKLPFNSNEVSLFYTSHVIEHLRDEIVLNLFSEVYRTLKMGGGFRITCPDSDLAYSALVNNNPKFFKYQRYESIYQNYMQFVSTPLCEKLSDSEFISLMNKYNKEELNIKLYEMCNLYNNEFSNHINFFNFEKLNKMLREVGFSKIELSHPYKSKFQEMQKKSKISGFDYNKPEHSIYVEVVK